MLVLLDSNVIISALLSLSGAPPNSRRILHPAFVLRIYSMGTES